jgi:hypothetical protein
MCLLLVHLVNLVLILFPFVIPITSFIVIHMMVTFFSASAGQPAPVPAGKFILICLLFDRFFTLTLHFLSISCL